MDEHIDLFDAYEQGNLSGSEQEAFHERLKTDVTFKTTFEQYQHELKVIRALSAGEEMSALVEANESKKGPTRIRYLIPMGVAAALVLLFFVLSPEKQPSGPELFVEYFEVFPDAVTGRSVESEINKGMALYEDQQYTRAIEAFGQLSQNDTTRFYKGLSHLALQDADQALVEFNQMNGMSFSESAGWYKGLSFLLLDEKDSALIYLEQSARSATYYQEASELLKKLEGN